MRERVSTHDDLQGFSLASARDSSGRRTRIIPREDAMFTAFPLLLIVVILYNLVAFGGAAILGLPAESAVDAAANAPEQVFSTYQFMKTVIFSVPMPSGSVWSLTYGDLFVTLGLIMLFVELIRSTQSQGPVITNHALSLGVLVLCLVEFIIVRGFATSTFFFLMVMAAIDVIAGFIISLRAARRDLSVTGPVS
ncbi:MAG: hypothetical protein AAFV29_03470 [Myxococcota bacterium]